MVVFDQGKGSDAAMRNRNSTCAGEQGSNENLNRPAFATSKQAEGIKLGGGVQVPEPSPKKAFKQWWNLANFWVHSNMKMVVRLDSTPTADVNEHFSVLSFDISHLSSTWQYLLCAGGVMVFLLLYGYLQELVVMNKFKRSLGWFVTLLQFSGYTFYAWLQRLRSSKTLRPKVPVWRYVTLAILQAFMQGMTNQSMHYLNYPAKVLFKSSRLVVTMLFGLVVMGKRYSNIDYVCVLFMVLGLVAFIHADLKATPSFDVTGLILIALALAADAALLNFQEHCMQMYNACHDEMVYFSYLGASLVVFGMSVVTGEIYKGVEFLRMTGTFTTVCQFLLFCGAGFLGVSCSTALTKRFGALVCAITTTARKAATLALSFILFNNPGSIQHALGAGFFIIGLLIKAFAFHSKRRTSNPDCNGFVVGDLEHGAKSEAKMISAVRSNYIPLNNIRAPLTRAATFHEVLHDPRTGDPIVV